MVQNKMSVNELLNSYMFYQALNRHAEGLRSEATHSDKTLSRSKFNCCVIFLYNNQVPVGERIA